MKKTLLLAAMAAWAAGSLFAPEADACTRVTYIGDHGDVITGRNLDWKEDIPTNLYVLPQGLERTSYDVADSSITWTSRFGSVVAVGYDMGVTEGMNQAGLCCNLLYLPGTTYSYEGDPRGYKMSSSMWAQFVLDNFATTSEAVQALAQDKFRIDAPTMPGGSETTLHMAISDVTGNSAIIEYIDGRITIHEGKQYQVLTNAPPIDQQLAINDYWKKVGGMNMLPGTNKPSDRFVRGMFYVGAIPTTASSEMALAGVFGVIFNCAVPVGISVPDNPEISSTRWRSVAHQNKLRNYYGTVLNPSIMWVDLADFRLTPGSPIMKLDIMYQKKPYAGNVIKDMKRAPLYKPLFRYN